MYVCMHVGRYNLDTRKRYFRWKEEKKAFKVHQCIERLTSFSTISSFLTPPRFIIFVPPHLLSFFLSLKHTYIYT